MVDRQELRQKAKGIGSSVAGTFKKGAKAAKSAGKNVAKNTKKGASNIKDDLGGGSEDVEVFYNNESETYLVYVDGEPVAQYESEMQAKAAAREIMREEDTESSSSGFKEKATSFAQGVNEKLDGAAQGMDQMEDSGGPILPMLESDGDTSPSIPIQGKMDGGPDALPFMNDQDGGGPEMPFANDTDAPDMPFFDGGKGEGPTVPGFAGQQGDGPQIVALDESADSDDTDRFPWMF